MPNPRTRTFLGLARETTKGTAVAATDYIPVDTIEFFRNIKPLEDKALRGSAIEPYNIVQGPAFSEATLGGPLFVETFPKLALSLLGDIGQTGTAGTKVGTMAALAIGAVTGTYTLTSGTAPVANDVMQFDTGNGAEIRKLTSVSGAGPYTLNWTLGLQNAHAGAAAANNVTAPFATSIAPFNISDQQGPAYTFTETNGAVTRQWPGCQVSELTIKLTPDALLEWSGKAIGYIDATTSVPVPAFTANPPQPAWATSCNLGGGAITRLESFEITIARPTAAQMNLDALQGPYKVWQDAVSYRGKGMFIYEDDTDFLHYLNNDQPAMVIDLNQGAGAAQREAKLTMTKCAFTVGKVIRTKGLVEFDATFVGVGNSTDVGGSAGFSPGKLLFNSAISDFTT